ncbi:MAG: cyclopropane fatty-acyl-phospholipid synthase-like methyltransferase [Bacteroidia bacterium]
MSDLPYSQACENNRDYIFEVLKSAFADQVKVLEIGSGTGQHACYFAQRMPWLRWQPSDLPENLLNLHARCRAFTGTNLAPEVALDVAQDPWPLVIPEAIYTANTFHIMPYAAVQRLFAMLDREAADGTVLAVYGPFNYGGQYTVDSNARFDEWLAQQNPLSAIRHFESVNELAASAGFVLQSDNTMPANNRLLVWQRRIG